MMGGSLGVVNHVYPNLLYFASLLAPRFKV
jgi:hypothetical protein